MPPPSDTHAPDAAELVRRLRDYAIEVANESATLSNIPPLDAADAIEQLQRRVIELERVRRDFRDEYIERQRAVIAAADVLADADETPAFIAALEAYRAARRELGSGRCPTCRKVDCKIWLRSRGRHRVDQSKSIIGRT